MVKNTEDRPGCIIKPGVNFLREKLSAMSDLENILNGAQDKGSGFM